MTGELPLAPRLPDGQNTDNSTWVMRQPPASATSPEVIVSRPKDRPHPLEPSKVVAVSGLLSPTFQGPLKRSQQLGTITETHLPSVLKISDFASSDAEATNSKANPPTWTKLVSLAGIRGDDLYQNVFDNGELLFDLSPRKRRRLDDNDPSDFVQLPKPPPRRNAKAQNHPLIPPLLQGLHEPPPDAGLFPPITSKAFHDFSKDGATEVSKPVTADPFQIGSQDSLKEKDKDEHIPPDVVVTSLERRMDRGVKKHKWSEAETRDLMQGVAMYGIGRWKDILMHEGFQFEQRSAVDLKDRFRVCRATEDRTASRTTPSTSSAPSAARTARDRKEAPVDTLPKSSLASDSIKNKTGGRAERALGPNKYGLYNFSVTDAGASKNKSKRRIRQEFTEAEDESLLRGFEAHGPSWSAIRNDASLVLQNRTPHDLRDRFRNKYPKQYAQAGLKISAEKLSKARGHSEKRAVVAAPIGDAVKLPPDIGPSAQSSSFDARRSAKKSSGFLDWADVLLNNTAGASVPVQKATGGHNTLQSVLADTPTSASTTATKTSTGDGRDEGDVRDHDLTLPIVLDRSIFDWANQNSGAAASVDGTRELPFLSSQAFSFEHVPKFVNPLATWNASGSL